MRKALTNRVLVSTAVLAGVALVLLPTSASAAQGKLTQLSGTDGCVSETGTSGACADGKALDDPRSVVVSPDGKHAYAVARSSDAVAVFSRNATTGKLTQLSGIQGCVSETGSGGACTDGKALDGARSVAISPNGASVYVGSQSSHAIAVFSRNATTGALTQLSGTAGCVSDSGSGGDCADGKALLSAQSVAVSPDGASVYAVTGAAVAAFSRNTSTGALTQLSGTDGCVSDTGNGGICVDGKGLKSPWAVTVSPDGESAYVAVTSGGVAAFSRNTSSGALTQLPGTEGCVSETGTGGDCADGKGLNVGQGAVTVSPNSDSAYVAAQLGDSIAVFARDDTDTTPPDTEITSGPADGSLIDDDTPTFSFASPTDADATFRCRVDGGSFAACTSPRTTAPLTDGEHTFRVRARDAAGNQDPTPAIRTFTVDTAAPQTTITSGPAQGSTIASQTPTFEFSSEAGVPHRRRRVRLLCVSLHDP